MSRFPRILLLLALMLVVSFALPSGAQPSNSKIDKGSEIDKLIEKLLELVKDKEKEKVEVKPGDDELRQLVVKRFHVALAELKQRCEDFKAGLVPQPVVFEAARHLLQAELELYSKAADRVRILERVVDLVKWHEGNLERGLTDRFGSRGEYLRVQFVRMTYEIDLLKARREAAPPAPK